MFLILLLQWFLASATAPLSLLSLLSLQLVVIGDAVIGGAVADLCHRHFSRPLISQIGPSRDDAPDDEVVVEDQEEEEGSRRKRRRRKRRK